MLTVNYLFRHFLLLLVTIIFSTDSFSQNSKKDISCSLVKVFLDSLDNTPHFHQLPDDSSLIFLDPDNLIKKCIPERWHGYNITILKTGSIIDSMKHFEPYFVLKGRCQYILLSETHDKKDYYLHLHQPCSNEFSAAKIRRRKGHYYIASIEHGVY